jgi:hypothetical protein
MTHLFLLLSFLSVSVGFAAEPICEDISSKEVLTSLRLQSFQCQTKTQGDCSYQECLGTLPSYPKPVLIIVPSKIESLRLHFHGHKLGKYPEYEKDLPSMVKSFGLTSSLCSGTELAVFPESSGNCTTYDTVLKDKSSIETFSKDLHAALGQNLKSAPIHISAHSGGGRVLSRFLTSGITTSKVSVFDGIYSENVKNSLRDWYKATDGSLMLATIKGMSPEAYTAQLKIEVGEKYVNSKSIIKGTAFDISKGSRIIHYSRYAGTVGATKAHYDVVTQIWPMLP